jgi:predicted restriction endonuclease
MKKHVKTYLDHFGYDKSDFIPCEVCGAQAVDIHHIEARGMGGSKHADVIENLMALCRKHHEMYGDRKQWKDWLQKVHDLKIKRE